MSVPCGLLLVRQLKDGFHHQGSPQDTDHDLDRNDNVVYKQNYGYASKQSNSIALDYDISKYTKIIISAHNEKLVHVLIGKYQWVWGLVA